MSHAEWQPLGPMPGLGVDETAVFEYPLDAYGAGDYGVAGLGGVRPLEWDVGGGAAGLGELDPSPVGSQSGEREAQYSDYFHPGIGPGPGGGEGAWAPPGVGGQPVGSQVHSLDIGDQASGAVQGNSAPPRRVASMQEMAVYGEQEMDVSGAYMPHVGHGPPGAYTAATPVAGIPGVGSGPGPGAGAGPAQIEGSFALPQIPHRSHGPHRFSHGARPRPSRPSPHPYPHGHGHSRSFGHASAMPHLPPPPAGSGSGSGSGSVSAQGPDFSPYLYAVQPIQPAPLGQQAQSYGPPLASPTGPHPHSAYATPVPRTMHISQPPTPGHLTMTLPQQYHALIQLTPPTAVGYRSITHEFGGGGYPHMMPVPHAHAGMGAMAVSGVPGGTGPSASLTALKRGHACGFCRKRKLRCSGDRPLCFNCIKYGRECEYAATNEGKTSKAGAGPSASTSDNSFDSGRHGHIDTATSSHLGDLSGQSGESSGAPLSSSEDWLYDSSYDYFGEFLVDPDSKEATAAAIAQQAMAADQAAVPEAGFAFSGYADPTHVGLPFGDGSGGANATQHHLAPSNSPPEKKQPSSKRSPKRPLSELSPAQGRPSIRLNIPSAGLETFRDDVRGDHVSSGSASPITADAAFSLDDSPDGTYTDISEPKMPITPISPSLPDRAQIKRQLASAGLQLEMPKPSDGSAVDRERPIALISPSALRAGRTPENNPLPPPSVTLNDGAHPMHKWDFAPPKSKALFSPQQAHGDPVEGLAERMGEFLVFASRKGGDGAGEEGGPGAKRRKGSEGEEGEGEGKPVDEVDGLTNEKREELLNRYFPFSRLFFEMSVSRFRYRLTFNDQRRPTLAILYAMYLWGTRFSGEYLPEVEEKYFQLGCQAIHTHSNRADRLLDQMRAGMLLSSFAFAAGRFHEGWMVHGVAMRLVVSTGLHQIPSCRLTPPPVQHRLLRQRGFLLPPPEDAMELGERIHTFWAIMGIQRATELATSFPWAIHDDDVTTPFAKDLAEMAAGNVTVKDDVTIRDLYRPMSYEYPSEGINDTGHIKWVKAVIILERAARLAILEPEPDSEYARAVAVAEAAITTKTSTTKSAGAGAGVAVPAYLDQPRYRRPRDYAAVMLGAEQFKTSLGPDGEFPVDRWKRVKGEGEGKEDTGIPSGILNIHNILNATHMYLHDINSIECENTEALVGARRSVATYRQLPEVPVADIDSFVVTVWSMISRVLIKEVQRLRTKSEAEAAALTGKADGSGKGLESVTSDKLAKTQELYGQAVEDAQLLIAEITRSGETMSVAKGHAEALVDLLAEARGE